MNISIKDYLKEYRISMREVQRIKTLAKSRGISSDKAEKEVQQHLARATEIEEFISSAKNFIHREILARKYIYGETNEQIAEAMNYSTRHIARLITSALCSLEKSSV